MNLTEKQIKKLIEIVRQYEVIYAAGISSSALAVREECDKILEILQQEKKEGPAGKKRAAVKKSGKKEISIKENPVPETKTSSIKKDKPVPAAVKEKPPAKQILPPDKRIVKKKQKELTPSARTKEKRKKEVKNEPLSTAKKHINACHLFGAYNQNRLPNYGGYIVTSFFDIVPNYSILEIVGFENVQDIYKEGNSLVFKTSGCKIHCLVEPGNYNFKSTEPVMRKNEESIPYRFTELHHLKTKKHQNIYIGKEPVSSISAFTILKPKQDDFSVLFYDVSSVFRNMQDFLKPVFYDGMGISAVEARKASELVVKGVQNFHVWLDL